MYDEKKWGLRAKKFGECIDAFEMDKYEEFKNVKIIDIKDPKAMREAFAMLGEDDFNEDDQSPIEYTSDYCNDSAA